MFKRKFVLGTMVMLMSLAVLAVNSFATIIWQDNFNRTTNPRIVYGGSTINLGANTDNNNSIDWVCFRSPMISSRTWSADQTMGKSEAYCDGTSYVLNDADTGDDRNPPYSRTGMGGWGVDSYTIPINIPGTPNYTSSTKGFISFSIKLGTVTASSFFGFSFYTGDECTLPWGKSEGCILVSRNSVSMQDMISGTLYNKVNYTIPASINNTNQYYTVRLFLHDNRLRLVGGNTSVGAGTSPTYETNLYDNGDSSTTVPVRYFNTLNFWGSGNSNSSGTYHVDWVKIENDIGGTVSGTVYSSTGTSSTAQLGRAIVSLSDSNGLVIYSTYSAYGTGAYAFSDIYPGTYL